MEISRHWRLRKQRYALVGEVCPHCDARIFPPRDICPECGENTFASPSVVQNETIYTQSVVVPSPAFSSH